MRTIKMKGIVYNKQALIKAIDSIYTFIYIEKDIYGKVHMSDVEDGLEELKKVLGLK